MQVGSEQQLGQTSKTADGACSTYELLPEQAQFLQSRSLAAQQFVRLVEYWSAKHSLDWLLLPAGGPPSK